MLSTPRNRILFAATVAGVCAVIAIAWFTLVEAGYRQDRDIRDCDRAVAVRDDGRAMWVWLVDEFSGDDPANRQKVLDKLDELLPRLECDDTTPTPIEAP